LREFSRFSDNLKIAEYDPGRRSIAMAFEAGLLPADGNLKSSGFYDSLAATVDH
jgi:hypothetical protein